MRIWVSIAAVALLVAGVSYALFSPTLQVQEIRIQRSDRRLDIEEVQRTLSPMFGSHIAFVSVQDIAALLENTLPDVAEVVVRKSYPSLLHVAITLDPLVARLEIESPDAEEAQGKEGEEEQLQTYDFLTSGGVYVQYPGLVLEDPLPVLHIADWGLRPYPGTQIMDPALLTDLDAAEQILAQQFGHDILKRTIHLRSQEYHIQTTSHALWFDHENGVMNQIRRYRTFLQHADLEKVEQYIDLRIEDKVVYR